MIKRAVVTGSSGFIGKALVEKLINLGADVIAIDRNEVLGSKYSSYKFNLQEKGVLDKFLTKDTVLFHLAANANVQGSVLEPRLNFEDNIYSLIEVLESARKFGCRIIFPSTASIYDPSNILPLKETAYVKPTSPYAASKVAGEAYCYSYFRSYGLDIRIARMFSVYGYGMSRFAIHDIIKKIQNNKNEIEILGDGTQIRDYLYIDDVITGLLLIAQKGSPGEDYNLASGIPIKLLDLTLLIAELMGNPSIKIKLTGKSFEGDVLKWYADNSKIKNIGFHQKISINQGLLKTIEWLKK